MKKLLLILALWAVTLTGVKGQAWEQGVPNGSFSFVSSAIYNPDYGLLFGATKGIIWKVNNGVIDTAVNINATMIVNRVNAMAFSGDSLLFHCYGKGVWKMKMGEPAELLIIPG